MTGGDLFRRRYLLRDALRLAVRYAESDGEIQVVKRTESARERDDELWAIDLARVSILRSDFQDPRFPDFNAIVRCLAPDGGSEDYLAALVPVTAWAEIYQNMESADEQLPLVRLDPVWSTRPSGYGGDLDPVVVIHVPPGTNRDEFLVAVEAAWSEYSEANDADHADALVVVDRLLRSRSKQRQQDTAGSSSAPAEDRPLSQAIQDAIQLLYGAVRDKPSPGAGPLLITFLGEDLLDRVPDLRRREWWDALRQALERGWDVHHLVRLSTREGKVVALVDHMLDLVGLPGSYSTAYVPRDGDFVAKEDLVIVPGRAALQLQATPDKHVLSTASFLSGSPEFNALRERFDSVWNRSPRFLNIHHHRSLEYLEAIADIEAMDGARFLVMAGLSEMTTPFEVERERADLAAARGEENARLVHKVLAERTRRRRGFSRARARWPCRDLCPKRAIELYVETGEFPPDEMLTSLGAPPATPRQVELHLNYLIELLTEENSQYELGLLDGDDAERLCETFWLARADQGLILEVWVRNQRGQMREVDLTTTEPTVANAFVEYFSHLWDGLDPGNRRREDVVEWLSEQKSRLRSGV